MPRTSQFLVAAGADPNYSLNDTKVIGDVMGSTMSLRSQIAKKNRLKTIQALINGGLTLDDNYFMCRLNFRRHVGKSKLENLFDKKLWAADACEMLHVATIDGDLELVNALVDAGVALNTTTKIEGYTVTHCAALSRDIGVLKAVVAAGAPINEKDREEATPLAAASSINFPEGVTFLMDSEAIVATQDAKGYSPILLAAYSDDDASVNKFLASGVSPNVNNANYGITLLHLAAAFRQKKKAYKMTKGLLASGASPVPSNVGNTPATDAAVAGHEEVMDMLIEHGDQVMDEWKHPRNENPPLSLLAHTIESSDNVDLFNRLVDNNLDVHRKGVNGTSLLHLASYVHRKEFVKLLVEEHDMDINAPDQVGRTPLMMACTLPSEGEDQGITTPGHILHAEVMDTMFALGADPEKQVEGATAIMYACETGHEVAYDMLKKQYKVDENMKIKDGKGGQHTLKECLAQAKDKLAKKKTRKMISQTMGQMSANAGNAGKFVKDSVSSSALGF